MEGSSRYNASMSQPQKIAIVLPNPLGDVVMATPALRSLREHFKDSAITHIGQATALEILDGAGLADYVLEDVSRHWPSPISFLRQVWRVSRSRFDLAVLLANSFRSAVMCRLGLVRRLVGYDRDGRGWMLGTKLDPPRGSSGRYKPIPAIDYYNHLAEKLGATTTSRRMSLAVSQESRAAADEVLVGAGADPAKPMVMLNPGASFGPSKVWPALRFAALADMLIERQSAQIVINAAPGEKDLARQVSDAMRNEPTLNMADHESTLTLLKGLIQRCRLVVTNDTGARHVAAALGTDVVTIFGSTDPKWAQIDFPRQREVRVDVPCGPCQKPICRNAPGPDFHRCMTAITAEMVLQASEELLNLPNSRLEASV